MEPRKLWTETNSEAVLFFDDVHSDGLNTGSLHHKFSTLLPIDCYGVLNCFYDEVMGSLS